MRASHLYINNRINEIKSTITPQELFDSDGYMGYLTDVAEAASQRYHRNVRVRTAYDPESEDYAFTDNKEIFINVGFRDIEELPIIRLKHLIIIGILAHETGHILYSHFPALHQYKKMWESGVVYPDPSHNLTEKERVTVDTILSLDENNLGIVASVALTMNNIIEDIFVDAKVCQDFPGQFRSGIMLYRLRFLESCISINAMIEQEYKSLDIVINLILQYCLSGDINNLGGYSGPYLDTLVECIPILDDAMLDASTAKRQLAANIITIKLWPYISELLEEKQKKLKGGANEKALDEEIKNGFHKLMNSLSKEPKGDTQGVEPIPGNNSQTSTSENKTDNSSNTNKNSYDGLSPSPGQSNNTISNNQSNVPNDIKTNDGLFPNPGQSGNINSNNRSISPNNAQAESMKQARQEQQAQLLEELQKMAEVYNDETGRIELAKTDEIDASGLGGIERDYQYTGSGYAQAAEDIEKILTNIASQKAIEQYEEHLSDELLAEAQRIQLGNAHKKIRLEIHRMLNVKDQKIEEYNRISADLIAISKRLQRKIKKHLSSLEKGEKITGLFCGNRIDTRSLMRDDGKIFCRYNPISNTPDLAIAVLVDESQSMSSSHRITHTRAAAIILEDLCRSMKLPLCIYGHSTGANRVNIYSYVEFNSADQKDKYRLMDISPRRNNRDGAAIRFVAERLLKRREENKLLIVISDGQPNDTGYKGTVAEVDIRGIKASYAKKGITLFAAAIGSDKDRIKRIYRDGYLDITDLTKLPEKFTELIIQHICRR